MNGNATNDEVEMPFGANLNARKAIQEGDIVVDGESGVAITENFGIDPTVGLVDLADTVDQDGAVETDRKPDVRLFRNLVMSSCRNLVVGPVRNLILNSVRNLVMSSCGNLVVSSVRDLMVKSARS